MERIVIPDKIHSLNVLNNYHWGKKLKLKKQYQLLVRNQMRLNQLEKCEIHDKFSLKIISYRSRLLDQDNLIGGSKLLIDALCDEGYIWDDCPKYLVTAEYHQARIKGMENKTLIERKPLCK